MGMEENRILSFCVDREPLRRRERALRSGGFEVVSVNSESQARFEIEMGRCGVLLMCYRTVASARRELAMLFRRNCPRGKIIFVMRLPQEDHESYADISVLEADEPEAILEALQADPPQMKKTA
jgi:hypothetical protein